MLKNRGIKCSWCLDESPIVFRKLWFNKPDRVTKKTENFGEMLVECYDLDPDEWSKNKMRDAVICYVCICSLRIAYSEKQEVLAAAKANPKSSKSIKDTVNKPHKQSPKMPPAIKDDLLSKTIDSRLQKSIVKTRKHIKLKAPDEIDLESKIDSRPRKSKVTKGEPQKPIKLKAPDEVDLDSKINSRLRKSKVSKSELQKPIKSTTSDEINLESKLDSRLPKSNVSKGKPQKPIKSNTPDEIDLKSKINSRLRKSKVSKIELQKPIKSTTSDENNLESKLDSRFRKSNVSKGKPQKPTKSITPDEIDLKSKINSRLRKSKVSKSELQKPIKSTTSDEINLESKLDSRLRKSNISKGKPQKPIKSTVSYKVDLKSKIHSRPQNSRKSKLKSSEPQKPIKPKADKVDVVFKRERTDPPQKSTTYCADVNIKEEHLEISEEEYLEEIGVQEPGNETFMEEEEYIYILEDIQPPKETISLERIMPGLQVECMNGINPFKQEINLDTTEEVFKEEYMEETKPDIDKIDLNYQYESLDHLPDELDANKSDTEDLSPKPNMNVEKSLKTRGEILDAKKTIHTEDSRKSNSQKRITEDIRKSNSPKKNIKDIIDIRKSNSQKRIKKDIIVRKSKRKIKLTAAAKEYKNELKSKNKRHILDPYIEDEMVIIKSEDKIKTESETKENCGDFDKVYLEDANEDMYFSENLKSQNYVPRRRKEVPTPERLNEIVDKLNKNKLSLHTAAKNMGFSYTNLKSLVKKHPKYIPMPRGQKNKLRQWTPEQYNNVMEVLKAIDNNQMGPTAAARKLGISAGSVRRLRIRYTGYDPTQKRVKFFTKTKDGVAQTISRIKAEFPEQELRSMMVAIRQKKLMMKVARKKLRCNPRILHKILIEMCGSTGRGSNVTPEGLLDEIQSILTYSNATPFRLGPGRTLTCAYCFCLHGKADIIDTPDELRAHTRIRHNAIRLVAVKRFTKLGQEILRVDITKLQCTVCATPLPSWYDMLSHLETRHSIKLEAAKSGVIPYVLDSQTKTIFTCALCPKQFLGICKLNQHMNSHATGNKCFICNKTFMYNDLLRNHERRTHNKPENKHPDKQFCCDQCGKVIRHEKNLKHHIAKKHEGQKVKKPKLYCCEYCGIAYNTHTKCAWHIHHIHEGVPQPFRVRCKICLDRFPSKLKMDEHMRKVHNMKVTYTCDWCPRKFVISKCLMKHLNKEHNQNTSLSHPTEL